MSFLLLLHAASVASSVTLFLFHEYPHYYAFIWYYLYISGGIDLVLIRPMSICPSAMHRSHCNGWNTANQTTSRSRADNGRNHFRWMFNYFYYTLTSRCIAINWHIRFNWRSVFIDFGLLFTKLGANVLWSRPEKMKFIPNKFVRMSAEQRPSIIVTTLRHISHCFNGSWHLSIRRLRLLKQENVNSMWREHALVLTEKAHWLNTHTHTHYESSDEEIFTVFSRGVARVASSTQCVRYNKEKEENWTKKKKFEIYAVAHSRNESI